MTDHQQNDDIKVNQALMTLDWDVQPDRDLWPDISSRIRFAAKPKTKQYNWAPAAIAACMLFAFGALVFSSLSYQRSQQTYAMQASYIDYQKSQINLIEQQHKHVRAQFVALLSGQHGSIDSQTVAEVQAVLMTIDSASVELKQAILAQPLNTNYSTMLARTYQDELRLLNKFKSNSGTSI
jgi:hypothetical protein